MPRPTASSFPVLGPDLQMSFYYRLQALADLCLTDALQSTIARLDVSRLNDQLTEYVSADALSRVASFGLRGEVFFAVPYVLEANPFLLGYYRLLYGFSQKEFYTKGPFGRFLRLEESGQAPAGVQDTIPALCRSLAQTGEMLVNGLDRLSLAAVHDLQLLTLGPTFRGSELNRIGRDATKQVFDLVQAVVASHIRSTSARTMLVRNASGRDVLFVFADDPDVRLVEKLETCEQPLLSIEVKGGGDASNVYNRIGEAEKSHLKAKQMGFFEFWTIVRADFSPDRAKVDSPTTGHFFRLDRILDPATPEYREFRDRLCVEAGIPSSVRRQPRRKR